MLTKTDALIQIPVYFTEKEIQVVALMVPGTTPEQIVNSVVRTWLDSNVDRMYKQITPQPEMLDKLILTAALASGMQSKKEEPPVQEAVAPVAEPAPAPAAPVEPAPVNKEPTPQP